MPLSLVICPHSHNGAPVEVPSHRGPRRRQPRRQAASCYTRARCLLSRSARGELSFQRGPRDRRITEEAAVREIEEETGLRSPVVAPDGAIT